MRAGGFIYSRSKNYTWEKNTTRWSAHPEIESLLSPYKVPRTGQHPTISLVRNEVDKARYTQLFITENSPIPFSPKLPCHQNGERGRTSVSCRQLGHCPGQGHSTKRCAGASRFLRQSGQKYWLGIPKRSNLATVKIRRCSTSHMKNLHFNGAQTG
jgi:hypothetical protein